MSKRIAIVTSGGDAPGMNAAVRAVVRAACAKGWRTLGVLRGFEGLMQGRVRELRPRDVGGIMQNGGTILGSARAEKFREAANQRAAIRRLKARGVSALVVVGGNGSQRGSEALHRLGFPVIGVASTIDNDLVGSEPSIGTDTALNVALEAIDRLKATASSFHRVFLVEVMGRDHGYLALMAGLAGGAEAVVLPDCEIDVDRLCAEIRAAYQRGKPHGIIVVAEGARLNATTLARRLARCSTGFDVRVTILGHVQRGGRPTYFDRMLGTRLGAAAVESLARGERGVLVGFLGGEVARTPLSEVAGGKRALDPDLIRLAEVLSR